MPLSAQNTPEKHILHYADRHLQGVTLTASNWIFKHHTFPLSAPTVQIWPQLQEITEFFIRDLVTVEHNIV